MVDPQTKASERSSQVCRGHYIFARRPQKPVEGTHETQLNHVSQSSHFLFCNASRSISIIVGRVDGEMRVAKFLFFFLKIILGALTKEAFYTRNRETVQISNANFGATNLEISYCRIDSSFFSKRKMYYLIPLRSLARSLTLSFLLALLFSRQSDSRLSNESHVFFDEREAAYRGRGRGKQNQYTFLALYSLAEASEFFPFLLMLASQLRSFDTDGCVACVDWEDSMAETHNSRHFYLLFFFGDYNLGDFGREDLASWLFGDGLGGGLAALLEASIA